ncbi:MAG: ABC transporter ATP-binding protein, partial [Dehalococcoidia bacterium]|nr:ABC transporter ATP-binding protein [Dehalococcoidia bacterium]
MDDAVLRVRDLRTYFFTKSGVVKAVDGISFDLREGETLCLVGESGCGKTVTALSILGLVDSPPGRTVGGEIWYHQEDLLHSSPERLRAIRGNRIAMIFQDPQSSLNPIFTVGDQITEQIRLHRRLGVREAWDLAISQMSQVGIPQARQRAGEYPHQFSGGMNQRVLIAAALSCDPEVIIA